jgi:uncharacterized delta-60 repeat protein
MQGMRARSRIRGFALLGLPSSAGLALLAASACQTSDESFASSDGSIDAWNSAEAALADAAVDSEASVPAACPADDGGTRLDPSFGDGGVAVLSYGLSSPAGATSMRVQADGKVVIGGTMSGTPVLVRLLASGALDPSFGTSGLVKAEIPDAGYVPTVHGPYAALGIQPDGKIVAAAQINGAAGRVLMVARYLTSGAPDPAFGSGGAATADFDEAPYGLVVLGNGQILVSGTGDVALARYDSSGALDMTFGSGGKAAAVPGYAAPGAMAIVNGKIVVAGGRQSFGGFFGFSFVRYTANGLLDTALGDGGTVVLNGPDSRVANDVAVDAMGRLLLAGGGVDDRGSFIGGTFVIVRVLETGALDPTFASNGVAVVDFGATPVDGGVSTTTAAAQGISVEPDGRIVVVGTRARVGSGGYPASPFEIVATRLTPVGTVDPSFGVGGKLVVSLAPSYDLNGRLLARGAGGCGLVIAGDAVETASPFALGFGALRLTP